jgi:hypothetical protein
MTRDRPEGLAPPCRPLQRGLDDRLDTPAHDRRHVVGASLLSLPSVSRLVAESFGDTITVGVILQLDGLHTLTPYL